MCIIKHILPQFLSIGTDRADLYYNQFIWIQNRAYIFQANIPEPSDTITLTSTLNCRHEEHWLLKVSNSELSYICARTFIKKWLENLQHEAILNRRTSNYHYVVEVFIIRHLIENFALLSWLDLCHITITGI